MTKLFRFHPPFMEVFKSVFDIVLRVLSKLTCPFTLPLLHHPSLLTKLHPPDLQTLLISNLTALTWNMRVIFVLSRPTISQTTFEHFSSLYIFILCLITITRSRTFRQLTPNNIVLLQGFWLNFV